MNETPTTPTDAKPDRIADLAAFVAQRIPALFDEARDQINASITAAMEQAQEKEKASGEAKAVLSIPIKVKWDLDGTAVVVSMDVNVKNKFEVAGNLDDPRQRSLALDSKAEE